MTIYFEWSDDLSVGDEVIDSQHKRLLIQINKIIISNIDKSIIQVKCKEF